MAYRAFDFDVHHDGVFFYQPLRYVSDVTMSLSLPKYESFDDFLEYIENATRSLVTGMYYVIPGNDLVNGLLRIRDDFDLNHMYDIAYCYGRIDIYLNHIQDHEEALGSYLAVPVQDIANPGEIDNEVNRDDGVVNRRPVRNPALDGGWIPRMVEEQPVVEDPVEEEVEGGEGQGVDEGDEDEGDEDGQEEGGQGDEGDGLDDVVLEEGPRPSLARCLFQDKQKQVQEEVVQDTESDSDYVLPDENDCSSDTESDTASIDYLSEGEDELRELRIRKMEAKKAPKTVKQPQLDGQPRPHVPEVDMVAEHDEFITQLLTKLRDQANDEPQDPFQKVEQMERWPIHQKGIPWRLQKPQVGERYENYNQFKECLTYYGLANGFSIWYEKSTQKKVIARCGQRPPNLKDPSLGKQRKQKMYPATVRGQESKCPWRCFGRRMTDENSFQVVSMVDQHTCTRNFRFGSLVNYKWIGKQFGNKIRANPGIKLVDIADMVMKKYKCIVTSNQCRAAKNYALNEYQTSIQEHYGMLRAYGSELLASNPGSTVRLHTTRNPDGKVYFDRMYICLHGLKEGLKVGCRKVVALDGCFLKAPNSGELLTAIGRDGNNHIFPIAWAMVSVENKDNWSWFLDLLSQDLDIETGIGLTVMSDQHKGLIEAVKDVLPHAEHRQCARHIYEGFRKKFTGVHFRSMFWAASKASYPQLFDKVMKDIQYADPRAHQYLMEKNPKSWSRAFFKLHRGCENVENGFSECFNSVILTVRNKPIITMFESIRSIVMERQSVMRTLCQRWESEICPSIQKRLEWVKDQQRFWKPFHAGGPHWEVRQLNESFKVNEQTRTCSCRMWELSGIPCPHACAVIYKIERSPEDYVPGWFRRHKYLDTYSYHIMPVGGMSTWNINDDAEKPLPPLPRRMPGRPKKKRRRSAHEGGNGKVTNGAYQRISREGLVMTCKNCFQKGHNKARCPNAPVEPPPKPAKTKGRPRKQTTTTQDSVGRNGNSRGQASVSMNGQPVARVEVGRNSRGQARVHVGGASGCEATVNLSGGEYRGQPTATHMQEPQLTPLPSPLPSPLPTPLPTPLRTTLPTEESQTTPLPTQESQTTPTTPPRARPRWTKCKILHEKTSPMKGTSAGPPRSVFRAENLVIGSHSAITNASASLAVTSAGYQKRQGPKRMPKWWGAGLCVDPVTNETFIGGSDGIPVPIWPKDVPIPSATEEYAKKMDAMDALKKKMAVEGKKRAVEAVKRMANEDALKRKAVSEGNKRAGKETLTREAASEGFPGTNKLVKLSSTCEGESDSIASRIVITKAGGANKQVKRQAPPPIKQRLPSERILKQRLAKQIDGPGSTHDSPVELH